MSARRRRCLSLVVVLVSVMTSGLTIGAQAPTRPRAPGTARLAPAQSEPTAIVPFTIRVPDSDLADLRARLSRARFADEFSDAGWDYGMNLSYLKGLVAYWQRGYNWRAQETRLNRLHQFTTVIDGITVHFVHERSTHPKAMPLLLLNGWPSSMVEYTRAIDSLTDPVGHGGTAEDSFDVIIPSMPGFGFSSKPTTRGYDPERIARMWVQLMARLGYSRYAVHGSDWGAGIATRVALDDPAHVAALHLAGCGGAPNPAQPLASASTANRLVDAAHNLGYQEIQSTKPQTLGQGLSDSPVALASWIVEKWFDWSDHDGDLDKTFTRDDILTNVMLYWLTNSGASSARLYFESRHMLGGALPASPFVQPTGRVTAPTGCGAFPSQYDRRSAPLATTSDAARQAAEARFNLVHFTTLPRGGHFPALEQPALWVGDVRAFFHTVSATASR